MPREGAPPSIADTALKIAAITYGYCWVRGA